jgi:hypothetical protein
MTYARDPYDTDEPPCFCDLENTGPVLTTAEFCPAHGDPDKPAPEPPAEIADGDDGLVTERAPDRGDVERDLNATRIRIIGARMVWAYWAREQAQQAAGRHDRASDGDAEWRRLSVIDQALQRAEGELETALRLLGETED